MYRVTVVLLSVLLLGGCSQLNPFGCQAGDFHRSGKPCWVVEPPERGLVVESPFYIRREQTRAHLFEQALVELSRRRYGAEVNTKSIVKKYQQVINNNSFSKGSVVSLATVNTPEGAVEIKAKIIDEWRDQRAEKMYLWVEED
ncbi:hypothetical protein D5085_04890 [Ectothiorhodospiraceae bacterium BW-2]|nr:hypothetical protein D5085_04890 [Ectothiorhodospiraceae bacterium BW-2]